MSAMKRERSEEEGEGASLEHEREKKSLKLSEVSPSSTPVARDYFLMLPHEVLLQLFSYVDTNSLICGCRVSRQWRRICEDNVLWKLRFEQAALHPSEGYHRSLRKLNGNWKKLYLKELLHVSALNAEQQVVIGRGVVSTTLPYQILNEFRRSGLISECHTTTGKIPHSVRGMSVLVHWVKVQHSQGKFKELQIVKVPRTVEWRIVSHPEMEYEWVEEVHRTWKASTSARELEKLHTEMNRRKRKVVIDIGPQEGLQLSELGLSILADLTQCFDEDHLLAIPRDHPALVQIVLELGERAGKYLRILSIPLECRWFIKAKLGAEAVSESYSCWPVPTPNEYAMLHSTVVGNKIVSKMMSREEWEEKKQILNQRTSDTAQDLGFELTL